MLLNFDLKSYLENTGVWYKSVESNTGSSIFELKLKFFRSVPASWRTMDEILIGQDGWLDSGV